MRNIYSKIIHSIEYIIFNRIIHLKKWGKLFKIPKWGQEMASEPSWGPSIGNRPLKWTEIGPTNDPSVISDEFETSWDNHFWLRQTRTKIFVQNVIHFIKIQNIHSKQIFICLKIQNIHSKEKIIFLKSRIFIQKKYSFFFKIGRIARGYAARTFSWTCPIVFILTGILFAAVSASS